MMIGAGKNLTTVLTGFAMVAMSLLALPVLMRFFTWTTGQVTDASGAGGFMQAALSGAVAVGALRGYSGGLGGSGAADQARQQSQRLGPADGVPSGARAAGASTSGARTPAGAATASTAAGAGATSRAASADTAAAGAAKGAGTAAGARAAGSSGAGGAAAGGPWGAAAGLAAGAYGAGRNATASAMQPPDQAGGK
jgi:hypothetical protein